MDIFGVFLQQLSHQSFKRLVIAYSGGLDSTVLLHLASQLKQHTPSVDLLACHVNHGISTHADQWQSHCEKVCRQWGLTLQSHKVSIATASNLEEQAREARFGVFEEVTSVGDLLLLAHHADDQIETFFQRLLRGSGLAGLAAIPSQRALATNSEVRLFRPLLPFTRQQLLNYAQAHQLSWIEDESNESDTFQRNWLRNAWLPQLEKRWPGYRTSVGRSVALLQRAAQSQQRWVQAALSWLEDEQGRLLLERWSSLPAELQQDVLHGWIVKLSHQPPAAAVVEQLQRQLMSHPEREILVEQGGWQVRRYDNKAYLLTGNGSAGQADAERTGWSATWDLQSPVTLPDGRTLTAVPCKQSSALASSSSSMVLRMPAPEENVMVSYRQGGERCHPVGRQHSNSLKRILQEYKVPPWERSSLVLVFYDDVLAAVVDLFICDGFAVSDLSMTPGKKTYAAQGVELHLRDE